MQSIVEGLVEAASASETRTGREPSSGVFSAAELPLSQAEFAGAIAMAVHRGLIPQRRRSVLPMRG